MRYRDEIFPLEQYGPGCQRFTRQDRDPYFAGWLNLMQNLRRLRQAEATARSARMLANQIRAGLASHAVNATNAVLQTVRTVRHRHAYVAQLRSRFRQAQGA